jgi:ABC-type branched-subunit amino acid transport system permease subunit
VAGAVVGGALVVTSKKILTYIGFALIGVGIFAYEPLFPMMLVVTVLFLQPEGIMGAFDRSRIPGRPLAERIRNGYAELVEWIKRKR